MLKAWEPRDIVKFYGELGYALHQRRMVTNWSVAMEEMLKEVRSRRA